MNHKPPIKTEECRKGDYEQSKCSIPYCDKQMGHIGSHVDIRILPHGYAPTALGKEECKCDCAFCKDQTHGECSTNCEGDFPTALGKEVNVCPKHGNKELNIEPPHYCEYKIREGCNCICTCKPSMGVPEKEEGFLIDCPNCKSGIFKKENGEVWFNDGNSKVIPWSTPLNTEEKELEEHVIDDSEEPTLGNFHIEEPEENKELEWIKGFNIEFSHVGWIPEHKQHMLGYIQSLLEKQKEEIKREIIEDIHDNVRNLDDITNLKSLK